jgi:hypothetical protein
VTRYDASAVLAQLKDFQRDTVEHVFSRMYTDAVPVHRFLVADEVGLGKTLVARGLIAKAIEHLQGDVRRIDIIYVCSNAQIARQNLRRLHAGGDHQQLELAERITMLPARTKELKHNAVNLISFTPGTSFDLKGGVGMAAERALLRLILRRAWGEGAFKSRGSMRAFQGGVSTYDRFRSRYQRIVREYGRSLDDGLIAAFADALTDYDRRAKSMGQPTLREQFAQICETFRNERPVSGWTSRERRLRNRFIGDVRDLLARVCLDSLEPDLIILDEFQRFKHLLEAPESEEASPGAQLASELFNYVDRETQSRTRVLLLSATPYKMLTTSADAAGDDEDHHEDLVATVDFLLEHDKDAVDRFRGDLRDLRRALLQVGRDRGLAAQAGRERVEATLRRVVVRTERLAATSDRSGMLAERPCDGLAVEAADIEQFVGSARLARLLDTPDPLEYWKSAPYILNFMDDYKLREEFDKAVHDHRDGLAPLVRRAGALPWPSVRNFRPIDARNPRLRWLTADVIDRGAWQLLWVPPALPYLTPEGPYAHPALATFTKRLVFSSWTMVPKAIATLLSYEAERRMAAAPDGTPKYRNTVEQRQTRGRLLEFSLSGGRLTGLPVLGLLYPSVTLAEAGDPLALSGSRDGTTVPIADSVNEVASRIRDRLDGLVDDIAAHGQVVPTEGRVDETWYWAAPIWMDWLDDRRYTTDFFDDIRDVNYDYAGADPNAAGDRRFLDHLRHIERTALGADYPTLGRIPTDLPEVLAKIALTGPGVIATRTLARISGRRFTDLDVRRAACRVAWALRSLFNLPETTELIRSLYPGDPYWQRILDYALAGNLQSVLDEYAHVLVPMRGYLDPAAEDVAKDLATAMHDTINIRTVNYAVSRIEAQGHAVRVDATGRMRASFAVRLSDERSDDGSTTRVSEVRDAFNSPFWPFVLTTTSIGQEGLDFHSFCHAIVHWNLPSNPVDLEQREGRVHRFKGHAVRKNVAGDFGRIGRRAAGDPWEAMFTAAHDGRAHGQTDIVPYWVYVGDGQARIDRYIPALPLSRDRSRAEALKRSVASYRLAFGQPRQDDLLAYLEGQIDPDEVEQIAGTLKIDLVPPPASSSAPVLTEGGVHRRSDR